MKAPAKTFLCLLCVLGIALFILNPRTRAVHAEYREAEPETNDLGVISIDGTVSWHIIPEWIWHGTVEFEGTVTKGDQVAEYMPTTRRLGMYFDRNNLLGFQISDIHTGSGAVIAEWFETDSLLGSVDTESGTIQLFYWKNDVWTEIRFVPC